MLCYYFAEQSAEIWGLINLLVGQGFNVIYCDIFWLKLIHLIFNKNLTLFPVLIITINVL